MKTAIKPMTPGIPHNARIRAYLAGAIITTALCGVAWRAWALQVEDGAHYRELADRQHGMTVNIPAPRGDVVDAQGRPLAVSADADSIWANPREIRDVTDTADKLAKLLGADPAALEAKLAGDRKFVWLDRHVTHEIADAVRAAKLPGIWVAKEPRRWYPGGATGGPVIGRADIDSRGLEGIELSMNDMLLGERGEGTALRDARGRRMFADGLAQPEPGATVHLSLDRSIQAIADRALEASVTANQAKSGVVVVLEVATGRVLAMSSYPSYDPNSDAKHVGARNKPVTDAFEAGSVMKVFTVAAAIDDGTVKPDTEFDIHGGSYQVGPKTIRDVHHDTYLTVSNIIKRSSNVGTVQIGLKLGREKLYAALKKFGFGSRTQIELPGEQPGMMRDGSRWREIELATISFGYGITVTPLQIAASLAALGNGGVYHAPRIVERVVDPDGTLLYAAQAEPHQMVSTATAEAMRKMLGTVFEGGKDGGTAANILVPGFRCGGKTGTAHKWDPVAKQYSPDRYLSSFAGLAPIDNPRLAIVVMVDEPSGGDYYGGKVAGPVFATVASEALRYLGVPGRTLVCPPPVPGLSPYLDPTPKTCTIPSPKPARIDPKAPPVAPAPPPAIDVPAPGSVPDFGGMGLGRALDVARTQGIAIEVVGSGRVIDQVPAPGATRAAGTIKLVFSDGNSPSAGARAAAVTLASLHEIGEAARSIGMTLRDLIDGLHGARVIGDASGAVRSVQSDSRAVEPGDVFVAVRGMRSDGHAFVQVAIDRGAAAVVVERADAAPAGKVPVIVVPSGSIALGVLVGRALGDPAKAMTLIGITGTNGKTTTTYLVESILVAAGKKPGVIGTVTYRWGGQSIDAPYTTPTPQVLHETFAKMRDAGCTHVVMEVSSIAISMDRVAGIQFTVAAFSNLTQDHLDVHGSMEAYRDAKRRLFSDHLAGTAVVNVDDPEGAGMAAAAKGRVLRVTAAGVASVDAEIRVTDQHSTVKGIDARVATPRGELDLTAKPLIGHYNVENLALAAGIGEALGLPHDVIVQGIAALPGVPGRVERVANKADLDILVDYAHTPDALRNVLSAVRPLTERRLICVFGCGGDRDPTKRPKMGAAVTELADLAVVTSDNPRTEDPRTIIDQILPGVPRPFLVEVDRAIAIRAAIAEAVPGDVVVIAGKGHEDYQIVGTTKHHFDDREQAAEACMLRETRLLAGLARDAGGEVTTTTGRRARTEPNAPENVIGRIVIDSRKALPGALYVAIKGEQHDGHAFCAAAVETGAVAVMVEHAADVAVPQIVVGDTRIALGKIARHHRRAWPGKIVAITGSAGKTTTKELTRAALAAAGPTLAAEGSLNNETGVPLTLLGLRLFHAYGVIEMGMRGAGQIEYLTKIAEPDVAVVVNAGSAHIELLGSTDAIAKAKGEIWLGLRDGGTIVRPVDDDRLGHLARTHRPTARHVTFGEADADVTLVDYQPLDAGGALVLDVFGTRHEITLHLVGRHAALDACAAIAAAHAAGASIAEALAGIGRARPPAMRGEVVELGGRKVIVDCYNANPASMAAAMRALAERAHGHTAVAVVGDMLELGDHAAAAHRDVGVLARELGLGVIALGDQAGTVTSAFGDGGETAATPAAAAKRVLERTTTGDWILLKASRGMKLERVLDAIKETVR